MTHLYGPAFGHKYIAWVETGDGLVAVDTGWDVAEGDSHESSDAEVLIQNLRARVDVHPDRSHEGSDVEALVQGSEERGKPVTHVLLTHDHPDHVANLPYILERWPDARVYAHANSSVEKVTDRLEGGETLEIGGERIESLYTPGHSAARDDLCYYLPEHRFLFCGDVAQPQGPSYAYAIGPSPVPNFYYGDAYRRTLERLLALDPHYMRTGHGDFLGPEQVKQWFRVTLTTITRIEELAIQLVERYPNKEVDWLVESIYDQIVDERHFGLHRANRRKRESGHDGTTDYERFDAPGIRHIVELAR